MGDSSSGWYPGERSIAEREYSERERKLEKDYKKDSKDRCPVCKQLIEHDSPHMGVSTCGCG